MSQAIPIYVVSLARAMERRATMTKHLTELGLNFEITDAVDGRHIPEATYTQMLVRPDVPLSRGDVGCYLSHMNIYEQFLQTDANVALVLEDDATLGSMMVEPIRRGIPSPAFDICFLDSWFVGHKGRVYHDRDDAITVGPGLNAYRFAPPPYGTHAYLITRECAQARLAQKFPISESIDWYLRIGQTHRLYGLIEPRGAWLNEAHSIVSFVARSGARNAQPWHMQLRRMTLLYDFWNWAHPSMRKARAEVALLQQQGVLPPQGRWAPIPPTPVGGGPRRNKVVSVRDLSAGDDEGVLKQG